MVTFDFNQTENILTCCFSGKLDTLSSTLDAEAIDREMTSGKGTGDKTVKAGFGVIFDLNEVNYISSSFIRICVDCSKQVQPGQFSIVNCDPTIKKTFKIVGLDHALNVC